MRCGVAAVQADVSLDDKWDPDKRSASIDPYTRFTREAGTGGADLVVWAETAIPAYVRFDRELMDWVRDLANEQDVWLYTGFPDARRAEDGEVEKFNSSGLFNTRGILVDRYAKHHLLPIGEAMPFTRFFPALARIDVGQAEWTPGPPPQVMTGDVAGEDFSFSGLICFESILGRLARGSVRRGSTCLMVLTNDGWFGETAGPRQHTALALLRAAECNVPLVRCANNGISLICDHRGRVQGRLGLGRDGLVLAPVTPGSGGTLFVRLGPWPLIAFLMLFVLGMLLRPVAAGKD
jgi:apolipoprotein N-acyltransferase